MSRARWFIYGSTSFTKIVSSVSATFTACRWLNGTLFIGPVTAARPASG